MRHALPPRMERRATPAVLAPLIALFELPRRSKRACAVLVLAVAAIVPSVAQAGALTVTPPNPVAGDTVTVPIDRVECPSAEPNATPSSSGTFKRADGTTAATGPGTTNPSTNLLEYKATLSQAGDYTATTHFQCGSNTSDGGPQPFTVKNGLGGSISVSPDPPLVNQAAALSAAATGGNPGYTFSWDLDNNGTFGDSTSRTPSYTFTSAGAHVVSVKIADAGGVSGNENPAHTTTVTKTITVSAPTPAATSTPGPTPTSGATPTPTQTPPPPCNKRVAFKLSEFKTTGCFTKDPSSDRWTTTSAITLNGLRLPDYGQTFTILGPPVAGPGGELIAPDSTVKLDDLTIFSGSIDWKLPDGGPGQEAAIPDRTFAVASGAALAGLKLRGSYSVQLGHETGSGTDPESGAFYADLPVNVELPASFKAGPSPDFGSVTGAASVRVDDNGVNYNGLRLKAQDVWLGRLKVHSVCFSYIPANGMSTEPCDPPAFGDTTSLFGTPGGDAPFLPCNADPTTNRWDASAEIEVPTGLHLGAYGGLADGQVNKLGANIANLQRRVPIAYGVYLDNVAFGLCLSPSPFKIRAKAGVNFLGSKDILSVDGGFTYIDGYRSTPWSFALDGGVKVGDLPIGNGNLGINGNGQVDFGLTSGVDILDGVASFSAGVSGWVDPPRNQWVVGGYGRGCLGDACAEASGSLSNVGVAGCVTVGNSLPTYDLVIPLDGSAVHLDTSVHKLTAGFGYVWGASTADFLGGSCNFAPYQPTRVYASAAAAGGRALRVKVARDTRAVALRVHATKGPPKIIIRGPHGRTIVSPEHRNASLRKGDYLLAENKTDGTTNVVLDRPAAGTYTVSQAPGSASSPTRIERASVVSPPTFAARVQGKRATRTLRVAYSVPEGTTVALVERAKGIKHTLAAHLTGKRCPGLPRLRPGTNQRILCAKLRFHPSVGQSTKRKVQAVVTRRGIPLSQKSIATFRTPKLRAPSRPKLVRAKRRKGGLVILFSRSTNAARYAGAAKLSDGRKLAFDLPGKCRALRIGGVPAGVSAAVKIAGVRFDLVTGRMRTVTIKANARSAGGSKSKKLKLGKVCH